MKHISDEVFVGSQPHQMAVKSRRFENRLSRHYCGTGASATQSGLMSQRDIKMGHRHQFPDDENVPLETSFFTANWFGLFPVKFSWNLFAAKAINQNIPCSYVTIFSAAFFPRWFYGAWWQPLMIFGSLIRSEMAVLHWLAVLKPHREIREIERNINIKTKVKIILTEIVVAAFSISCIMTC